MSRLPVISGDELIKFLTKKGFSVIRQKGIHVFLKSSDGRQTVVPRHKELDRGTLMAILAEINIERAEFVREWNE